MASQVLHIVLPHSHNPFPYIVIDYYQVLTNPSHMQSYGIDINREMPSGPK